VADAPTVPKSDFARVDDVDAVPFLSEGGRAAYREYLAKMTPRAFALSPSGAWCWAEEGEDPDSRAMAACEQKSNQPCRLYSVDDYVVWRGQAAPVDALAAQPAPEAGAGAPMQSADVKESGSSSGAVGSNAATALF
jgi:hypothetical protein